MSQKTPTINHEFILSSGPKLTGTGLIVSRTTGFLTDNGSHYLYTYFFGVYMWVLYLFIRRRHNFKILTFIFLFFF